GELRRQTLRHALRALHEIAGRPLQRLVELVLATAAVPAAVLEDLVMLGRQHQHGVTGEAELRVSDAEQAHRQRARELLRRARLLVNEAMHALAVEQGHRALAGGDATALGERL